MNTHSRRSRDKPFVTAKRAVSPLSRLVFSLCAIAFAAWRRGQRPRRAARAQYEATLAGIPVAGAWTIEIGDDTFRPQLGGTAGC
jgi:hypothetical protein